MYHLLITIAITAMASSSNGEANLPKSLDLSTIRSLVVQHDGRWPPLDTVARDLVEEVTGEPFHQGHDPVLLLLAWTFDSPAWMRRPLIKINNAELRGELQLPASQKVFSYAELTGHRPLQELIEALGSIERGQKMNPLESKVNQINGKLQTLQTIFLGQAINAIPDAEDALGAWQPVPIPTGKDEEEAATVPAAWALLRKAFLADQKTAFSIASEQFKASLDALPAAHRPGLELTATELRYNSLQPFHTAWIAMVVSAALAALAMVVRRKWFDAIALLGIIVGFALLTYGLSLRWEIAGRIPASNMFESLLFLSWGMGGFAIIAMLVFRQRIVPLTASAMGALALFIADVLPLDSYVRPIAPVLLDTVWMSIHVPIIMVSYSILALGVLIAHVQIVAMTAAPARRQLADTLDSLHYWYVHIGSFLLLAGIITGSMWAASSWGRYWGWDPKEVWSLVALLGYLTILHVRIDHQRVPGSAYTVGAIGCLALLVGVGFILRPLSVVMVLALVGTAGAMAIFLLARGRFAVAVKSVLAFWMIIMTYVGVNYVLGIGLHSYGFGTGAVATRMFTIGGLDLAFVGLCCLIYLARRRPAPKPGIGLTVLRTA